jgi:hypothetical protein
MEWVVNLETRNGWGEVETIEVGRLDRRVSGLTAEEVGMMLAEGKNLLGELGRLILQTQMEEFTTRVCGDCLKLRRLRDQRTRKVKTLFGTISVDAPRISACRCRSGSSFVDVSLSPLTATLCSCAEGCGRAFGDVAPSASGTGMATRPSRDGP